MSRIKSTTEDIQSYVKKFDDIKNEIEDNNSKFTNFKMEIDAKKLQIQLLQTEIENIKIKSDLREKTKADIDGQKSQLTRQLDTLKGLHQALETQLKNI